MKPILLSLSVLLLSAAAVSQQSLGDVARKARSQQKPSASMTFDQDSMRAPSGVVSTVGQEKPEAEAADKDKPAKDAKGAEAVKADDKDAKDKDKDKKPEKAKADDWNKKVEDQQKEIATLQRELDILQREQRLRAAAYYGDAGTQLRDQQKFADDSRHEQEQIDSKKQSLDAAQQKLADFQEQARRAAAN